MNNVWRIPVLVLSLCCLAASYFTLPTVRIEKATADAADSRLGVTLRTTDTLALPKVADATFERVTLNREVVPGETLGFILRDRFVGVRDSLSAFAKTSLLPANLAGVPEEDVAELMEMVKPVSDPQNSTRTTSRFRLRGVEREFLASDLMGAEDASAEIAGKLIHLSDAGKSSSPEFHSLEAKLRQKQSVILDAKRRLAEKERVSSPLKRGGTMKAPVLTAAQRDRIMVLSAQLPIDTQRVFAPIAGRYFRPDDGAGYIIAESFATSTQDLSPEKEGTGYILKSEGQPTLWGTAQRSESSTNSTAHNSKELKVSIQ